MCCGVITSCNLKIARAGNRRVNTMAKPPKIAPATKYGGKMVVCHVGITVEAKSNDTTLCTERTSGVERPANNRYAISYAVFCLKKKKTQKTQSRHNTGT